MVVSCVGLAFDPKNFTRTQVLRENVLTIWWNADTANNELTIAVEAKSVTGKTIFHVLRVTHIFLFFDITGFVGIGISANGGMYGADIAGFYKPTFNKTKFLLLE